VGFSFAVEPLPRRVVHLYWAWCNAGSCTSSVRVNTRGLPGDRHKVKKV
jgi:hypothetical protein